MPSGFAKKYLENGNKKKQTIVLKTTSGDKWRVGYLKMVDRFYFIDGWFKFMKENHLQNGDFLVFWLVSRSPKSSFNVFCYASNGCLKNSTSSSSINHRVPKIVVHNHNSNDESGEKKLLPKEETSDDDSIENVQQTFKSDNPYYMTTIRPSYLRSSGVVMHDSQILDLDSHL